MHPPLASEDCLVCETAPLMRICWRERLGLVALCGDGFKLESRDSVVKAGGVNLHMAYDYSFGSFVLNVLLGCWGQGLESLQPAKMNIISHQATVYDPTRVLPFDRTASTATLQYQYSYQPLACRAGCAGLGRTQLKNSVVALERDV